MSPNSLLAYGGVLLQVIGTLCLILKPALRYFKGYILKNTAIKKEIEDEAIGTTFNRVASDDRQKNLSDSIARGFITTYKNTFFGLVFITLGLLMQVGSFFKIEGTFKMINFVTAILVGCGIFLIFVGFKLKKQSKDIGASWQSWTLAVSLLALAITLGIAERNFTMVKRQLSLNLRPFVVATSPHVAFIPEQNTDRHWMRIIYGLKNFGSQPAHEYQKKNDLAIWIKIPQELFDSLEKVQKDTNSNQTQKDNALLAIDNWRKSIMDELYNYLVNNPLASPNDVDKEFGQKGVHCSGGIYEYLPKPTVISPNQTYISESNRDVGPNYGRRLASGDDVLVCYLFLTYESSITGKKYSTYYMCYSDKEIYEGDAENKKGKAVPLIEYRQWMDRDTL